MIIDALLVGRIVKTCKLAEERRNIMLKERRRYLYIGKSNWKERCSYDKCTCNTSQIFIKLQNTTVKRVTTGTQHPPISHRQWSWSGQRKVHSRIHAGNLGQGILKPRSLGIGSVISKLIFGLLEKFILADHFLLQPSHFLLQLS